MRRSVLYDIILLIDGFTLEESESLLHRVNSLLYSTGHGPLKRVDQYSGGEKVFCPLTALACVKDINIHDFLYFLRKLSWKNFKSSSIIFREDGGEWHIEKIS